MRLEELDLDVPAELVAQVLLEPRDACRLMVVDPRERSIAHRRFHELPMLLGSGDVLVVNDSRVLPARLFVTKETGGRVELLFLRPVKENGSVDLLPSSAGVRSADDPRVEAWEVLARPSNRLKVGRRLRAPSGRELHVTADLGEGRWHVRLEGAPGVTALLNAEGKVPLPPYITRPLERGDAYQTVYARVDGSSAAPTAGLHFTPETLSALQARGVEHAFVTLHVGLDTFRPVTEPRVEDHAIHTETYEVAPATAARLDAAREEGRRFVAVGTTSVRVLETLYRGAGKGEPHRAPLSGRTDVFITPGHQFTAVDALITNFHLPRTSLLALVMAFAGPELVRSAYAEAVARRYRFFSFGDAMLLTGRAAVARQGAA